tara:strand:+ start:141 stop:449 length:309 start_codon:yes stop_codon:yes gene_type:complete
MKMILTTFPSLASAEEVIGELFQKKLIACAQIDGPVRSYYRWDGKLNDGEEWRVLLKTTAEKLEDLELETRRIHDYDTPQWLVLDAKASVEYLKWVNESMVD